MADRPLRIGVLGAGGAAQIVHLPILARLAGVEIAGIADPDRPKARTIGERFGIDRVADDLVGLAAGGELDAVLVCTPNGAHEEGVLEALEHGAHVLCERPLTVSSLAARRLVEAADAAGRQLMVANNHRFRHDVRLIRQFVASGELGEVFFVRSSWLNRRSRRPRRGWRTDPKHAGGGVLMDLGAQALDMALWAIGYPTIRRVSAQLHGDPGAERSAFLHLAADTGATLTCEVTWEWIHDRDIHALTIIGTGGSAESAPLRVHRQIETGIVDVTPPIARAPSALYQDSYRQEWAHFLRIVRGEIPLQAETQQIALFEILEACYRSADTGTEVTL
ncbi:MAG: Gfo/Idh/MocA family oxidoreductase [Gemmatimonadota bacterium]|nr:Gfo/Idh/MocA family oxidoreductase [Gemmatimonadota bacterium]